MRAYVIHESYVPHSYYDLPNGVGVIALYYDGSVKEFKEAPNVLEMDGRIYGKSSHNSDTYEIVYRTDCKLVKTLRIAC